VLLVLCLLELTAVGVDARTAAKPAKSNTTSVKSAPDLSLAAEMREGVILQSGPGSATLHLRGDIELADRPVSPASTFKVVVAAAALADRVCTPETRHQCADRHLPFGTAALNLHQALVFSSNDYFAWLGAQVGKPSLTAWIKRLGYPAGNVNDQWLGQSWRPVIWGGKLKITARGVHDFTERLAAGRLPLPAAVQAQLRAALAWPSPDPNWTLFGKTGCYDGAVWFTGFAEHRSGEYKVFTILLRGNIARRHEAIGRFYRAFGLTWDKALLRSLR